METWGGGGCAARQPWKPPAYAKRASVRHLYATTPLEINNINPGTLFKGKTKHLRAYIKIKAYKVSSLIAM